MRMKVDFGRSCTYLYRSSSVQDGRANSRTAHLQNSVERVERKSNSTAQ